MSNKLSEYLISKLQKQNLSLRAVAQGAGISPSSLSKVINEKTIPELKVCNALADYFDVSRIKILQLAGWLDLNEDEMLIESFKERSKKDPEFAEFIKMVLDINDEDERKRMMRIIRAGLGK